MMTTAHQPTRSALPSVPHPRSEGSSLAAKRERVATHRRPHSAEADEAYRRSVMEQAATDIAAGW